MGVGHAGHSDAARSRGLLSVCRFAVWPVRRVQVGSVDSEPGLSGPANWLQVGGLRRRGVHAACATRGQASARATGTATGSGPTSSDSCAYRSRAAGASVPVLRSRRRRQNRPAASSQALRGQVRDNELSSVFCVSASRSGVVSNAHLFNQQSAGARAPGNSRPFLPSESESESRWAQNNKAG